jgi:hypothetical protein
LDCKSISQLVFGCDVNQLSQHQESEELARALIKLKNEVAPANNSLDWGDDYDDCFMKNEIPIYDLDMELILEFINKDDFGSFVINEITPFI